MNAQQRTAIHKIGCLLKNFVIYRFCSPLALSMGISENYLKLGVIHKTNLLFVFMINNTTVRKLKLGRRERINAWCNRLSSLHSQTILGNKATTFFKKKENKDHGSWIFCQGLYSRVGIQIQSSDSKDLFLPPKSTFSNFIKDHRQYN